MAAGQDYDAAKKLVFKGLGLLAVVTVIEVLIALLGNGHIIEGFTLSKWIMYPAMILLSLYKAYFIVSEFMHMRYEAKSLALTVLFPLVLLVWALIAFLWEGGYWEYLRKDFSAEPFGIYDKPDEDDKLDMKYEDDMQHAEHAGDREIDDPTIDSVKDEGEMDINPFEDQEDLNDH